METQWTRTPTRRFEFQLHRDMVPVGRPHPVDFSGEPTLFVGFPGLADRTQLRWPTIKLDNTWHESGPAALDPWHPFQVQLFIDQIPLGTARWAFLFARPTDGPSLIAHFPTMMGPDVDPYLSAWWTVYGRCADVPVDRS